MKKLIVVALFSLAPFMANANLCILGVCIGPSPAPAPAPPAPVKAPEIDGAAGGLAIALVGGGLVLLKRSRRPR